MKTNKDRNLLVTVFSDASNGESGMGCGWWFKSSHSTDHGSSSIKEVGSSNEAEIWGVSVALREAISAHSGIPIDIVLQCDSMNALQAVHSIGYRWARNSKLTGPPRKKYTPFEERMVKDIRYLKGIGNIYLKHVKGHTRRQDSRHSVNRLTDSLASKAMKDI